MLAAGRASVFALWAAFFPVLYTDIALAPGGTRKAEAVDFVAS